jgi:hypothetical protein
MVRTSMVSNRRTTARRSAREVGLAITADMAGRLLSSVSDAVGRRAGNGAGDELGDRPATKLGAAGRRRVVGRPIPPSPLERAADGVPGDERSGSEGGLVAVIAHMTFSWV